MSYGPFGTSDYLTTTFSGTRGTPISMVAWIKRTPAQWADTSSDFIVHFGDDFADIFNAVSLVVNAGTADTIKAVQYSSNASSSASFTFTDGTYDDIWVPVVGVFIADDDKDVYIEDSSNFDHSNNEKITGNNIDSLTIGIRLPGGANIFAGLIAEVALFNVELTTGEIDNLQTAAETGPAPNTVRLADCIGYWSLDTDQATHTDESGNGGPSVTETGNPTFDADHPTIGDSFVITDVDGDETWNDGDTGLIITGTGFV